MSCVYLHEPVPPMTPQPNSATPVDEAAERAAFDAFAAAQAPADLAAATWLARHRDGDDPADPAFQSWLRADATHRASYDALRGSLARVQGLSAQDVANLSAPHVARPSMPDFDPRPRRRAWLPLALAASLMVTSLGGWLAWQQWQAAPLHMQALSTQRGQTLDVTLPDGSRLTLDAATTLEVRLHRDRREARLVDGQAHFAVQADRSRPFDVLTEDARVTVVGTRFSVRHTRDGIDASGTRVAVEEGRVRVTPLGPGADVVDLGIGQAVRIADGGRAGAVETVPPASVGAWRRHRVSFDDTPLAQAIAEFERYGATGLVVRDPAVGALRVGGSFDLRQSAAFARALPLLLPVRLQTIDGRTEIVAAR